MRKRKYISYILLAICLCMQMAMAYPHHHHSNSICTATDLVQSPTNECTSLHRHHHHTDDADKHSCSSVCVTKFECGTPHSYQHVAPDYSFYIFIHEPGVPDATEFKIYRTKAVFSERLHPQAIACTQNLRAPPAQSRYRFHGSIKA